MHNIWLNSRYLVCLLFLILGCTSSPRFTNKSTSTIKNSSISKPITQNDYRVGAIIEGVASYYGFEFAGRKTANGEDFNPEGLTAAHRTMPFGTILRVTSKKTSKSVIVRVNDRGPFTNCILDLSYGAAKEINQLHNGEVQIEVLKIGEEK